MYGGSESRVTVWHVREDLRGLATERPVKTTSRRKAGAGGVVPWPQGETGRNLPSAALLREQRRLSENGRQTRALPSFRSLGKPSEVTARRVSKGVSPQPRGSWKNRHSDISKAGRDLGKSPLRKWRSEHQGASQGSFQKPYTTREKIFTSRQNTGQSKEP